MRSFRFWLVAAFSLFSVWHAGEAFLHREMTQPHGVLAPEEPLQTEPADRSPILHGKYTLTPLADYLVTARLLSRERYRFDRPSAVSPVDFALGWGALSDSAVLDKLEISQGTRWFWWSSPEAPPLPLDEISRQAANTHLIPADDIVRADLLRLRPGQVVTLEGQLVSVSGPGGFTWNSSLSRRDTGDGSCEILYVRKAFSRVVTPP